MGTMLAMVIGLLAARSIPRWPAPPLPAPRQGDFGPAGLFAGFRAGGGSVGIRCPKKAGFDVRGMSLFFERLQRASRVYENNAPVCICGLTRSPASGFPICRTASRRFIARFPIAWISNWCRPSCAPSRDARRGRQELQALVGDPQNLPRKRPPASVPVALGRNRDWVGAEAQSMP